MIVFWIVVIWMILWIVKRSEGRFQKTEKTPLQIAKERYAKGEITKKEFNDIKKEL